MRAELQISWQKPDHLEQEEEKREAFTQQEKSTVSIFSFCKVITIKRESQGEAECLCSSAAV